MDHVIYIPGLRDQSLQNKVLAKFISFIWNRYSVTVHVFEPHWSEGNSFYPKLKLIIDMIDTLSKGKDRIFLVGQSAGGSAALNAFVERKSKVSGVVCINGRLRKGIKVFPSLNLAALGNPAFKESVLLLEETNEKKLSKEERKRVMIIHSIWDDIVPTSTTKLEGTTEVTMPIITHMLGGIMACTVYTKILMNFLKKQVNTY